MDRAILFFGKLLLPAVIFGRLFAGTAVACGLLVIVGAVPWANIEKYFAPILPWIPVLIVLWLIGEGLGKAAAGAYERIGQRSSQRAYEEALKRQRERINGRRPE